MIGSPAPPRGRGVAHGTVGRGHCQIAAAAADLHLGTVTAEQVEAVFERLLTQTDRLADQPASFRPSVLLGALLGLIRYAVPLQQTHRIPDRVGAFASSSFEGEATGNTSIRQGGDASPGQSPGAPSTPPRTAWPSASQVVTSSTRIGEFGAAVVTSRPEVPITSATAGFTGILRRPPEAPKLCLLRMLMVWPGSIRTPLTTSGTLASETQRGEHIIGARHSRAVVEGQRHRFNDLAAVGMGKLLRHAGIISCHPSRLPRSPAAACTGTPRFLNGVTLGILPLGSEGV